MTSSGAPALVDVVREVGSRLRQLCAIVDTLVDAYPPHARRLEFSIFSLSNLNFSRPVCKINLFVMFSEKSRWLIKYYQKIWQAWWKQCVSPFSTVLQHYN